MPKKYNTSVQEVKEALKLADNDKKMILETKDKLVVMVGMDKQDAEKLEKMTHRK